VHDTACQWSVRIQLDNRKSFKRVAFLPQQSLLELFLCSTCTCCYPYCLVDDMLVLTLRCCSYDSKGYNKGGLYKFEANTATSAKAS